MISAKTRARNHEYAVIGVDTETLNGPPITLQFYSEDVPEINDCVFLGKPGHLDPTDTFLEQLEKLPPGRYRMYCHNLEFDMVSILWRHRAEMREGSIALDIGDWKIRGRYSKPIFAVLNDGTRLIELVDSFLWFITSAAKAAEIVCPHLPKLAYPKGLGEKLFTPDDGQFIAYAMRDAEIGYFLGCAIERFHADLDIPPSISLASMAAQVFRKHYMQANIYQPPAWPWMAGAMASYHGGKNSMRPGAAPAWHTNVTALDISSAYPHAMTQFPAFDDPNGYKRYKAPSPAASKIVQVPPQGIYCISGKAAPCDWPALFNHDFKPLHTKFADTWVTGYELNEALAMREVKLTGISGYHYAGKHASYSPFRAYVETFYARKADHAYDEVTRYMYKILLNALTGKFIQTHPDWVIMGKGKKAELVKLTRAGGLYQPFIASLITGHTRAAIHALEHRYEAIHTATDGIFAPKYHEGAKQKTLGAVVSEGHGTLALFRSKLYLFYTDDPGTSVVKPRRESSRFPGRYFLKVAKHGFQGSDRDLEDMLLVSPDERTYSVTGPQKLKTSLRGDGITNKFITQQRTLNIEGAFRVINHK